MLRRGSLRPRYAAGEGWWLGAELNRRHKDFQTLKDWKCFDSDIGKDLAVELREYFIPDFSNWKDHDAFEAAFARLQKDLKEETKRTRRD
ncbi:MAG: hypothetical protein ABSH15_02270 [Verrucomicrobiota bacterium]